MSLWSDSSLFLPLSYATCPEQNAGVADGSLDMNYADAPAATFGVTELRREKQTRTKCFAVSKAKCFNNTSQGIAITPEINLLLLRKLQQQHQLHTNS